MMLLVEKSCQLAAPQAATSSSTSAKASSISARLALRNRRMRMRNKRRVLFLLLSSMMLLTAGCEWFSRTNVTGVWKGSIESSDRRGHKWNGPAELTLNQNGDALTGTLSFTHPQGGRIQIPISSGVVSKDAVTFSGQHQLPMGAVEITFHGKIEDTSISGTADMTLRAILLGAETNPASLNLHRQ
jgi:hypothetical protein